MKTDLGAFCCLRGAALSASHTPACRSLAAPAKVAAPPPHTDAHRLVLCPGAGAAADAKDESQLVPGTTPTSQLLTDWEVTRAQRWRVLQKVTDPGGTELGLQPGLPARKRGQHSARRFWSEDARHQDVL